MTETLVLDMVQGSSEKFQSCTSQEAIATAEAKKEAVNACVLLASQTEAVWQFLDEELKVGVEGRNLADTLNKYEELFGAVEARLKHFLGAAEAWPSFPGKISLLCKVENALRRIQAVREKVVPLRRLLDAPRRQ